jgi:hypothetical protein
MIKFGPVTMNRFSMRSLVSLALTCWLGFIACVLGCAGPSMAAAASAGAGTAGHDSAVAGNGSETSDACELCHHRSNPKPSRDSQQNKQQGPACCALNAALIQKPNLPAPLRDGALVAALPVLASGAVNLITAADHVPDTFLSHAGGDVLLESHLLRI